jgi:hypothetical protein
MSSVYRTLAGTDKPPTKFSALITPSYNDDTLVSGQTVELPIPFTVANQVLDINVNQSADIQTFVNNGTSPQNQSNIQGKAFGGASLVTSFGTNMTSYLQNWIDTIESLGSPYAGPLVLYIQPFMSKVQLINPSFALPSGAFQDSRSWGITTEAPVSTEYTGGTSANNYYTAWIFKTPMTVRYVTAAGDFKYINMTSQFSED